MESFISDHSSAINQSVVSHAEVHGKFINTGMYFVCQKLDLLQTFNVNSEVLISIGGPLYPLENYIFWLKITFFSHLVPKITSNDQISEKKINFFFYDFTSLHYTSLVIKAYNDF